MENFKKLKDRYKTISICLGILIILAFGCAIALELLWEINLVLFILSIILVFILIILIVLIYNKQQKFESTLIDYINKKVVPNEYTYGGSVPILDLIKDSLFPYNITAQSAHAEDSIKGNIDNVFFEYYLCYFNKDKFFQKKELYEFFIFKNIEMFSFDFIMTDKKIMVDYKYEYDYNDKYKIYSNDELSEYKFLKLPENLCFMSVSNHNLYVFKHTDCKKTLYNSALGIEDFEHIFNEKIEEIKKTYEEAEPWMK